MVREWLLLKIPCKIRTHTHTTVYQYCRELQRLTKKMKESLLNEPHIYGLYRYHFAFRWPKHSCRAQFNKSVNKRERKQKLDIKRRRNGGEKERERAMLYTKQKPISAQ